VAFSFTKEGQFTLTRRGKEGKTEKGKYEIFSITAV